MHSLADLWAGLTQGRKGGNSRAALRVLVLSDTIGATQVISFERPLRRLVREGACTLRLVDEGALGTGGRILVKLWAEFAPTHLILSRYSGAMVDKISEFARGKGVPIICHLDDDLFAVPPELGEAKFRHYNDPGRLGRLRAAIQCADLVYASTSALADRLRDHGVSRPLEAGKIYCAVDPPYTPIRPPRTDAVTIGYMGTSGHREDVALIVPAIEALLRRHHHLRFETFGTIELPAPLRMFGDRVIHHRPIADYDGFLDRLAALEWDIGLAPLADNAFNACKANTKWVEYTDAGICVAASDLAVYRPVMEGGRGLLVSNSHWIASLEKLIQSPALRLAGVQAAQAELSNYTLEHLERQLLRLLDLVHAQV